MPRSSRNKPSSLPPAKEPKEDVGQHIEDDDADEMDEDGSHMLQFDLDLTWRAGKPIVVGELLRRLKALYDEIRDVDQEDAHRKSIVPKAQQLASQQLLAHRDNGVKAWTLLCIVEMFRLLAPDAPYKLSQLKDIFTLFVSTIIPALSRPSDPYNNQHLSILQSLVTVKSILLLQDAPGADRLIHTLFENCFDVVAGTSRGDEGEQLSKNVEYHMIGMLTTLIDEGPSLSSGVVEILLAQFLRVDLDALSGSKKGDTKPVLTSHDIPPAYNMAKSVCNTCDAKMTQHIGNYFNQVLIGAEESLNTARPNKSKAKKRSHDESDDESNAGRMTPPSETDLGEVAKAHRLLRELWKSCPGIVRSVIPQVEVEVGLDNVQLRTMGVETLGDMTAGIGAAGPPLIAQLDPAAFPSQSLETSTTPLQRNPLHTPAAPYAFSSAYPSSYQAFFDRHNDKAAQVRGAWTSAAGWIIYTSAGGKGLDGDHELRLLKGLSDMLMDNDEKVRLAAIQAVAQFDFHAIVQKIGSLGGVTASASVFANLANRIKDPKPAVRSAAIQLLARIWGVAAGSIVEGREHVRDLFGGIPSRILEAVYINDKNLNALIQRVIFDSLLPIGYPLVKGKFAANSNSQRVPDSQNAEDAPTDPDKIRVERLLVLVRDLEDKAKRVFFALQGNQQAAKAKYLSTLLDHGEKLENGKAEDEKHFQKLITQLANLFPDPSLVAEQLTKFLEHHDRRNYALMRFCIEPQSEYRKVVNAMKELTKRLEQGPTGLAACLNTITPLMHQTSLLVYNRSHVPAVINISRSNDKDLAAAAHEVLNEISSNAPKVFKVHIKDLCDSLKKQAPTATSVNDPSAVDSLKACAGFARQFPQDLVQDREFYKAMTKFAIYGSPPKAAKHAVSVIVSSADKKEMYVKEILDACIHASGNRKLSSLSHLAALGQLRLLANEACEDQEDAIVQIATTALRHSVVVAERQSLTNDPTLDLDAKLLGLKIFVNGLRGLIAESKAEKPTDQIRQSAERVFRLLNTLVEKDGELSSSEIPTPTEHCSQLRLAAAKFILKLCCDKRLDRLFAPKDFNRLTKIAQDESPEVRAGFSITLEKYLTKSQLHRRFHSLLFLYTFEPVKETKDRAVTFLKARASQHAKNGDSTMEGVFAFFLSLLAHHPDFGPARDDLEDFIDYITFYLKIVSSEKNLPAIYNVAQRLKTVEDGIEPGNSRNLYILSDLTEAIIRHVAELRGWSLQVLATKVSMPAGIYAAMPSHAVAQETSETRFLPTDLAEDLEDMVKERIRPKKRKSHEGPGRPSKRVKTSQEPRAQAERSRKASKPSKPTRPSKGSKKERSGEIASSSQRRKSARASNAKSYVENDDSEDDQELEKWQADNDGADDDDDDDEANEDVRIEDNEEDHEDEEANKENLGSSTPPTSDPAPLPAAVRAQKPSTKKKATSSKNEKAKQLPARGGRTSSRAAAKAKDEFDVPSDSD